MAIIDAKLSFEQAFPRFCRAQISTSRCSRGSHRPLLR
jgi:hypothetical protein